MIDFSSFLNLPLIWGVIIALAIFIYVLLDGFDLGVGIIFPFAPSVQCRDKMMNSVIPFWDGNETWIVLGGGGLFAAFPLAYSILLPAFYIPIIMMLLGLIMRGVAFEFRFKSQGRMKKFWTYIFHFGSLSAAFCQGVILGAFIDGVEVEGRHFVGDGFSWATGFSIMTGIAVIFGYVLLGSTWLIMKTDKETQAWARKVANYSLIFIGIFMTLVSIAMLIFDNQVRDFWFDNALYLSPIPIITAVMFVTLWSDIIGSKREYRPFLLVIGIFFMNYFGLGVSIYPWIVPFQYTLEDAAASGPGLSLMLIGVTPLLPIILGYTAYNYYVFRGKVDDKHENFY